MQRRTFLGVIGSIPAIALAANDVSTLPEPTKSTKRRQVGIAFGGGSIHGMAHVGVLSALTEKRLHFQFVTGTSAGAIIGILAAAGIPAAEIDSIARRIEWPGLMDISMSGKGLLQHTKLRALIDTALRNRRIEQLPIPFGAIATDVATGARVVIRKGSAGAAVSASCSIPVMFEPVNIDGRDLVDGGLTEPVPVIAVREMGADFVIGVDVAFRPGEDHVRGFTGAAFQTMHIMANALINEQLPRADIAIRMNLHRMVGSQNSHEQLLAAGYAEAMRVWPKIAAMLA